jgi:glutathione S-transferase
MRIVLHEKSIAHEVVEIDLDDKPEWLGELTPTRRVPVIRHDDFVLWESATVNEYLELYF